MDGALVVDRFLWFVCSAVVAHEGNVGKEDLFCLVETVCETLLHEGKIDRVLDDSVVVGNILRRHRFAERPRLLVLHHVAMNLSQGGAQILCFCLSLSQRPSPCHVSILAPPRLFDSWYALEADAGNTLPKHLQPRENPGVREGRHDIQHLLLLALDHGRNLDVVDVWVDVAFHQRTPLIVLDQRRPPLPLHGDMHVETLLLKVPDSEVVGVCEKVVNLVDALAKVFGLVH
mmetsp:Transcript_19870/g.47993  ORF Transcript_19870/g.47993 Transcript_19870/m.47993 type:complete len:231 (-) Transcript_19870:431-1123(-)